MLARSSPRMCSSVTACALLPLQLSTDMNELTFHYNSKGFGGEREWKVQLANVKDVRTGLPLNFQPCVSCPALLCVCDCA